ncbi:MAG: hypothetical protein JXB33_09960 [Clostridia bacterium]|nr:hypothetical protein [Clostridia bacterium]
MKKINKRRMFIMLFSAVVCIAVLVLASAHEEKMKPAAYEYYIENIVAEAGMPNAVTAIYLRYRIFDTLFEALLLAAAVSAVVYFAAEWEKEGGASGDE